MWRLLLAVSLYGACHAKIDSEDVDDSGDRDLDPNSNERLGPSGTQVYNHQYAATLLKNGKYECSAVILNTYWLLTLSKCFEQDVISTYVSHKLLGNYTVRVGSSFNKKGGTTSKIKMLINNFDLKVTAVKLDASLTFGSRVDAVQLPRPHEEVSLGRLASIVAWTPDGHIRLVNVPVIEASICEDNTKLLPGHYICVGGVQDPNRNFCRKDNGGAVIQNNTLIAMATFFQTCAIYTRQHAFPKVSAFARWMDSVIWDENNRPTTTGLPNITMPEETTETDPASPLVIDPSKFMLTMPYEPVNVPLEPDENNAVMPRVGLYESYLHSLVKAKTSTTAAPETIKDNQERVEQERQEWFQKYGKAMLMMPHQNFEQYDYN